MANSVILNEFMQERYSRQILLPQIGVEGQKKLRATKVLVVGAGGLGSPVLLYLAAAGVGALGIVDSDRVSISNLNRQILHYERDIGISKTASATEKLTDFNSQVNINPYHLKLTAENIENILRPYDVIVDCVDNAATRYLVNRHGLKQGKYIVEGGVSGFLGFVMSVKAGAPCYGCVRPPHMAPAAVTPVIGAAAGVIACLEAAECLKILLGIGEPLFAQALTVDLLNMTMSKTPLYKYKKCSCCAGATDVI